MAKAGAMRQIRMILILGPNALFSNMRQSIRAGLARIDGCGRGVSPDALDSKLSGLTPLPRPLPRKLQIAPEDLRSASLTGMVLLSAGSLLISASRVSTTIQIG